jgi:orotidine-5'-phosphate decarboxylase
MKFQEKLQNSVEKNNSLLCIGLDPDVSKFPPHIEDIFEFNKAIVDATADIVCCYKPQFAFYASHGLPGLKALIQTIAYIHLKFPDMPVILDSKRGDIGSTAQHYAEEAFEVYKADAVTINPYLGFDSVEPFLKYQDKGIFILCRTSNPGAGDFQDLSVDGEPLYVKIARKVQEWNSTYANCGLVVGATWPEQLGEIRKIAPSLPFLVPGIGAQGGDIEKTLQNGLLSDKSGLILNSSRAILYADTSEQFAEKARETALKTRDEINTYR